MHYIVAYITLFKKFLMYRTPPRRYFGSTWSYDCTGLNSSLFGIK